MHSLSDYEVVSSLPDSENSFKVKDKVNGGFRALHIVGFKDLGDFHTQSLLSRLFTLEKNDSHPYHIKYIQHFIKKDSLSIYIIMELADGVPLSHFVGRCREENLQFEENYIWRVLSQLYCATQIMSSGSLTLKNVFIDKKGDVKWNAAISENSTVPLSSQLGCLATEMCTAGESTHIPSFYTKELKNAISSLVLGEEVIFNSSSSKEYPRLFPRHSSDDTAALRNELFGTLNSRITSNPNIYESVIYADATICKNEVNSPNTLSSNVFEDALKSRLHAIRAQEALLRQKEANLVRKEKELFEREKRIAETERRIKEVEKKSKEGPPQAPRRPPKKKPLDDTYCTKELNETVRSPTVAKMKIPPLPPRIRSIQQQKKVTFKSPKKFIKYDIENISEMKPSTSRSSISSKSSDDSDSNTKRKSILSILGINSQKPNRVPERPTVSKPVNEVKASDIEQKWTLENKKAAFEMLAAMNAKNLGTEKVPSKSMHRNTINRRSCYVPRTCL
ncbi:hypothetical protein ACFFRR_002055 [Megaselia abdita]